VIIHVLQRLFAGEKRLCDAVTVVGRARLRYHAGAGIAAATSVSVR